MPAETLGRPSAVVLVGHGAVARDCPRPLVTRLKTLEAQRRGSGSPPTDEETALDARIRRWPRTADNDPYRAGLESLADHLRSRLPGVRVAAAYNEFCAPTIGEAVDALIASGAAEILVVPSMLTPGGVHAEVDIPQAVARVRSRHREVAVHYAWPVDLNLVGEILVRHLGRFLAPAPAHPTDPGPVRA